MAQTKTEENSKARERMAAYRETPEYQAWLIRSRELRRALKEKYRRQSGVQPRDLQAMAAKRAAKDSARRLREEMRGLHDAHVRRYARGLVDREKFARRYASNPRAEIARVSAYKRALPDAYVAQQIRLMGVSSDAITPKLIELKREAMLFGRLSREAKNLISNQRKVEHETVSEHA